MISYNILSNIEDSKECVNDTFFNAWKAIPDDRPDIFLAYLGKITRNISINLYNKKRAKKRGSGVIEIVLSELENIISNTSIDWMYPPQYFKKGNIVVVYVGEDVEIINALEEILGSQFI